MKFDTPTLFTLLLASAVESRPKIIGGTEVPKLKYKFITSLQINNQHFCGGVILNVNTVLTAAHCSSIIQQHIKDVRVHVLRHNLEDKNEVKESGKDQNVFKVAQVIVHPEWDENSLKNDVAVLKLDVGTFGFSIVDRLKGILPNGNAIRIKLDDGTKSNKGGLYYRAIGWGATSFPAKAVSKTLQEVSFQSTDNQTCKRNWQGLGVEITTRQVCYGEYSKDTCKGDSGGPVVYIGKDNNKPSRNPDDDITLVGLVSFAAGCASGTVPSVGTRVSSYLSFIMANSM